MGTIDQLRQRIQEQTSRLEEARREHVVKITTLASEAVDTQNEYIKLLERKLKFYEEWEDSRELTEVLRRLELMEKYRDQLWKLLVDNGIPIPARTDDESA